MRRINHMFDHSSLVAYIVKYDKEIALIHNEIDIFSLENSYLTFLSCHAFPFAYVNIVRKLVQG